MIPSSVHSNLETCRISRLSSFSTFCEATRALRTPRGQQWYPKDRSTWTVDTLQNVSEATRMEMDAHHCFQLVLVSAGRGRCARGEVCRDRFVRCSRQCGQQTLKKSSFLTKP